MQILRCTKGDITTQHVDAIVNAANSTLRGGGGVDGAIHDAAGSELLKECEIIGGCKTGHAVVTGGYKLPAKFVIHAVGPIYKNGTRNEAELLASCYARTLDVAKEYGVKTIAFPLISTGAYGYPVREAAAIAVSTVREWLKHNPHVIYGVLFVAHTQEAFETVSRLLL